MNKIRVIFIITLLLSMVPVASVHAQMATLDEAAIVANNWIVRVIQREGNWGGYDWAEIADFQEFTRNGRVIGHFFRVEPVGFIIVSLRKELAPVKAYSTESNLDPNSEVGMADLLKTKMEGILDALEQPMRLFDAEGGLDEQGILEIDYRPAWDELCGEVKYLYEGLESGPTLMDYKKGEILLTSRWHQFSPYNNLCPPMGCVQPPDYLNQNAPAGCGAIAVAQIMRYWAWPPSGVNSNDDDDVDYSDPYDWTNMLDQYYWNDEQNKFIDGSSNPCNQSQISSVSELCHEVGRAIKSEYACEGTLSSTNNLYRALIDQFCYKSVIDMKFREDYSSPLDWFDLIKSDLSDNRPLFYYIPGANSEGHFIVVDGWKEDSTNKKYHINYGWMDENKTMWYNLDEIDGGDINEEAMFINIKPEPVLGDQLTGNYKKLLYPYRYFDQDASGMSVTTFDAGQNLQFLPGIKVKCISGNISFKGSSSDNTRLFSIKGTQVAGIKIYNGAIKLQPGCGIGFY